MRSKPCKLALHLWTWCFASGLALSVGRFGIADEVSPITAEQREFFERHIRPVLVTRCYACHAEGSDSVEGGLRLDSPSAMRHGGNSGPLLTAEPGETSLLLSALRYEQLEMPPDGKLSSAEIAKFAEWLAMGAPDPRSEPVAPPSPVAEHSLPASASAASHWAYQPLNVERPAATTTWSESPLDDFVENEYAQQGLVPGPEATPQQLVRRIYFDLTGLPPTLAERDAYLSDTRLDAFARLVDQLLSSPRFGERWGRHWLDVARFAESTGGGRSLMLPDAWRFRDYVIAAFNSDMPFSQLVQEQLAGDLLPHRDAAEHDRHMIATGFLALGAINYELQDKELLQMEVVDEQLDTVGRAFLGMSLGCARCHDHKFDPISISDYYAMAGIFTSTKFLLPGNVSGYVTIPLRNAPGADAHAQHRLQIEIVTKRLRELTREETSTPATDHNTNREAPRETDTRGQVTQAPTGTEDRRVLVAQLRQQLERLKKNRPAGSVPVAMGVQAMPQPADTHLLLRGEIRRHGRLVPRRLPVALQQVSPAPTIAAHACGRLELANWIVHHPLAQRVFVNRVWQHLLGQGLVPTADDFGATGIAPSHPELLDYLAHTFVSEDHGHVKSLIRRIVLSHVYRLSSQATPENAAHDPSNRWLTRAPRQVLEAEVLRDTLLQTSGQLDHPMGGLTIAQLATYDWDYATPTQRRSVYVPRFRSAPLDIFDRFDVANPNMTHGVRNPSVLPTQALYLMNSPFVWQCAAQAVDRCGVVTNARNSPTAASDKADCDDSNQGIHQLFDHIVGRHPSPSELALAQEYLQSRGTTHAAWTGLCHMLYASLDFRYRP